MVQETKTLRLLTSAREGQKAPGQVPYWLPSLITIQSWGHVCFQNEIYESLFLSVCLRGSIAGKCWWTVLPDCISEWLSLCR